MSASYSGDASPARFHIEGMQHQGLQQLPAATDEEDSQHTSLQAILQPAPLAADDVAAVSSVVQRMVEAVSFRWVSPQYA